MSERIDAARKLAEEYHAGQTDKLGVPYIAHVEDIARRVSYLGEDFEIVGLLHDAIEDTSLTADEVESRFGEAVRTAVFAMTKGDDEDYFDDYLPRVLSNELARAVKRADSSHNLSKVHLLDDPATQERLRAKYVRVLRALGENPSACEIPIVYDDGEKRWTATDPKGSG